MTSSTATDAFDRGGVPEAAAGGPDEISIDTSVDHPRGCAFYGFVD
jgi:hypothetical protein